MFTQFDAETSKAVSELLTTLLRLDANGGIGGGDQQMLWHGVGALQRCGLLEPSADYTGVEALKDTDPICFGG